MRYVLIPCPDIAATISAAVLQRNADELGDAQRTALGRVFERTLQTCELLVSYAVAVGGKPSRQ